MGAGLALTVDWTYRIISYALLWSLELAKMAAVPFAGSREWKEGKERPETCRKRERNPESAANKEGSR
jgi:hypothetical protein